jgi:hypothetical protein
MKKLYTLLFFSLLASSIYAQHRSCATMHMHQEQLLNDPKYQQKQIMLQKATEQYEQSLMLQSSGVTIYTIPVVVHVLYNTSAENISDAQIYDQLNILNDDFRALNADTSSVPAAFQSLIADAQIEFCLATVDPNGNTTTGINRVSTTTSSFTSSGNPMKYSSSGGVDAWNTAEYLNIWVCNLGGGLLGYAQFPGGTAATDGVVVNYTAFGSIGTAQSPYDEGRTLTHEVGHWLNLRHIWGDANCGNDYVSDTPTQQQANYGCPSYPSVTCSNGPNGDMFMNYMDYVNDACMMMFTPGQRTRMHAALLNSRSSLLNSTACNASAVPGCTDSTASNYDSLATNDNGSCVYPCVGTEVTMDLSLDCWPGEISWSLLDANGILLDAVAAGTYTTQQGQEQKTFCLADGCYQFIINDSYGDGFSGSSYSSCGVDGSLELLDASGTILAEVLVANFGSSDTLSFCLQNQTPGCTDSTACNYDSSADTDDNSCTYPILSYLDCNDDCLNDTDADGVCDEDEIVGCTDVAADNYNPAATDDNGSCSYCSSLQISIINQTDATAYGLCDGTAIASVNGGTFPYNVAWTVNPNALCAGTYTVSVTDAEGCMASNTFQISEPAAPSCQAVTGFQVNDMVTNDPDGSRIKWEWDGGNQYGADQYQIRHRVQGTSSWSWDATGAANGLVTGQAAKMKYYLSPSTAYEAQIRRHCVASNSYSSWSTSIAYNTPAPCPLATNLSTSNVEDSWATFSWDAANTNNNQYVHWYLLRFSEDGGNSWGYKDPGTNTTTQVGNRTPNTNVQWQLRTYCNGDNYYRSAWTNASFTTASKPAYPTNLQALAPSAVGASQSDATFRQFNWDLPAGPVPHHYVIRGFVGGNHVYTRGSHDPTVGGFIAGNETSRILGGLQPATTYTWRMRAYHTTGIIYYGAYQGLTWRSDWSPAASFTTAAVARQSSVLKLKIYPNPSNDAFNIVVEGSRDERVELKVYNMLSEKVHSQELDLGLSQQAVVDLSQLPEGVYQLQVKGLDFVLTESLVKQ